MLVRAAEGPAERTAERNDDRTAETRPRERNINATRDQRVRKQGIVTATQRDASSINLLTGGVHGFFEKYRNNYKARKTEAMERDG